MKFRTGTQLVNEEIIESPWIIEGIIRERQTVMEFGRPGLGKSIFAKHALACVTSGEKFLDEYRVPKARKVCYIQCEGEDYETKSRWERIGRVIHTNNDNLLFGFGASLPLTKEDAVFNFINCKTMQEFKPELIVLDPLYLMSGGQSLSDDAVAGAMVESINKIKEQLNCAVLLIHHEHREKKDEKGKIRQEGIESYAGSYVWRANVSEIIRFEYFGDRPEDKLRKVYLGKNRNDENEQEIIVKLHGSGKDKDSALYFEKYGNEDELNELQLEILEMLLNSVCKERKDFINEFDDVSEGTIDKALKRLVKNRKIRRIKAGLYEKIKKQEKE